MKGFISSGCSLLNLALSDKIDGGYVKGSIVNLVGDSSSGKTILALTALAEAAYSGGFEGKLIYDDVERADMFDLISLFGTQAAEKIQPPLIENNSPIYSDDMNSFVRHLSYHIEQGEPFIYILDSFDALFSAEDDEILKSISRGQQKGSYGAQKARLMSQILRKVVSDLDRIGAVLIIISQTRDNLGFGFEKNTRSGGRALQFYSSHVVWLYHKSKLQSKDRMVGVKVKAKVKKNKCTGKLREVEFDIYYEYGIDDIGAMIDFLVAEGYWKKRKQTIIAEELGLEQSRQKLISTIEEQGLYSQLRAIVQEAWNDIEEQVKLHRLPRFRLLRGEDNG